MQEPTKDSNINGFINGTLVETEEGWTPIDELKVGDWVMSRPENGIGKAVPKQVVNTFHYEDKEVVMLKFSQFPERNGGQRFRSWFIVVCGSLRKKTA